MHLRVVVAIVATVLGSISATADIAPPPPTPPIPGSLAKAIIRGVAVLRTYTYWRGRRWMTVIDSCASGQAACGGRDLAGCFVVGANGHDIPGGDIDFLVAAERSAGAAPLKLGLDHCALNEIELAR
jgi:hypothetical protein